MKPQRNSLAALVAVFFSVAVIGLILSLAGVHASDAAEGSEIVTYEGN
jgi:hypothetical protein